MNLKKLALCTTALLTTSALANNVGQSTYPMLPSTKLISVEATGITSSNGGIGVQTRYTQKLNQSVIFDAGVGMSGSERNNGRLFAGMEYELFPDYMRQPRVSFKGTVDTTEVMDIRRTQFVASPIISKGYNLWGKEAFPFISVPVGISLDGDSNTYQTTVSANFGLSGNLPIRGFEKLIGSFETQVGLKKSYTGVLFGISYAL